MRRTTLAVFSAVFVFLSAPDLTPRVEAGPPGYERTWLVHGERLTDRVALVLDVSGSMRGSPLEQARREVLTVLSLFQDDGRARVYAFAGDVSTLACPEPDGWFRLPSADVSDAVDRWASSFTGGGSTDMGEGVATALTRCAEQDLSVVLVTDGEAVPPGAHLRAVKRAQEARRAGPAPVHVILIRPAHGLDRLSVGLATDIAKTGGGGVVVARRVAAH